MILHFSIFVNGEKLDLTIRILDFYSINLFFYNGIRSFITWDKIDPPFLDLFVIGTKLDPTAKMLDSYLLN